MNMAARPRTFAPDMAQPPKRELPSSLDAEAALLGAVFINDSALDAVPSALDEHHFSERLHGSIWREMKRLRAAGKGISPISIKMAVTDAPAQVGERTFAQYLSRLASEAVGLVHVPDNAAAILDAAQRRELISLSQKLEDIAYEHELEIPDDIKAIEDQLSAIRSERTGSETVGAGDSYLAMFSASTERAGIAGVPICLPEMAKVLSEPLLEGGNLYGFLSSSGEGKTSLTVQQIYHAIRAGHPVLFLSYDQSAGQCVRQMIAQVHGIEVRRQRDPNEFLNREEQNKCLDFATWINTQPLEIIRCQREGVDRLTAYARRFVRKHRNGKTPLIIIDHIGKVKPRDPKLSADRISGDVTVELKAFADETQAAVMILNQRNSDGTKRDNPRPIARDLYGGEGAKADYDAILFLYRPEKYREERVAVAATDQDWKKINRVFGDEERWKGVAEVGVIKSRFGDPTLREELKFEAKFTRYASFRVTDQGGLF